MVKSLSAVQETWVWPLGQVDPLEKGLGTDNCNILAGKFHGQRSLAVYSTWEQRVGHNWATNTFQNSVSSEIILHFIDGSMQTLLKHFKRSQLLPSSVSFPTFKIFFKTASTILITFVTLKLTILFKIILVIYLTNFWTEWWRCCLKYSLTCQI